MKGARILVTTILVFIFLLPSMPTAWGQEEREVRIAAWNLAANAYYRERSDAYIEKKLAEINPRVAAAIAAMDPDVIALCEVESEEALDSLAEILVEEHDLSYQPVYGPTGRHLNLAILARAEVELGYPELVPETSLGSSRLRESLWIPVTVGDFDFHAIVVHLKSGTKRSRVGRRILGSRTIRELQAEALAEFIAELRESSKEDDILVFGDYNMFPSRDGETFETLSNDFLRFITNEELCKQPDMMKCEKTHAGGNMLDGFGIGREDTTEYVEGSLERWTPFRLFEEGGTYSEYRSFGKFWKGVSDHLPIMARFRAVDEDGNP